MVEESGNKSVGHRIKSFFSKLWDKIGPQVVLSDDAKKVYSNIIDFNDVGRHKFHLRLLKDGRGILVVDARFVIYLNHTAMIMFQKFIEGKDVAEIEEFFNDHFKVEPGTVVRDFQAMLKKLARVLREEDSVPIFEMGIKTKDVELNDFPFRADIALTYLYSENAYCFPERSNNVKELDTDGIKKILDVLWELGVPNITFTGGEPSQRDDLMELIRYTEDKGFVTGLITNGVEFSDDKLVVKAIEDGLDYVQITIQSHDAAIHNSMMGSSSWNETVQALKNFEKADLYFMTRTTLSKKNAETIEKTIRWLHQDLNVQVMAFNALINFPGGKKYKQGFNKPELEHLLTRIFTLADELGIDCKFYSPNQHLVVNPIEVGIGPKMGSATRTSISIEPNGDVLPSFSYLDSVGNILQDEWKSIWYSKLFQEIRKQEYVEPKATEKQLLAICGGGMPLNLDD